MKSNSISRITTSVLALIICLGLSLNAQAEQINETRPADPDGRIQFQAVTGDFQVIGHDDANFLLEGELGEDVEQLIINGSPDNWRIELEPVKENAGWFENLTSSDLTLYVPRSAEVKISVVSGDLDIEDLDGQRVETESVSGDVILSNVRPQYLKAASVSGDVSITGGGRNETELRSVSGDVEASEVFGRIQVESVSGDLSIEAYEVSNFEAQSVSGDMELILEPLDRADIEISAHSGDIDLGLPAGTEMDLEASTFSGTIETEFSGDTENVYGGRRGDDGPGEDFHLLIGSGNVRIEAQTFSGDLYIERR